MPEGAQSMIGVHEVEKWFGAFRALGPVTTEIKEGEFFSLLGPSGCGKTTLLRMIGGFDEPTRGSISIGGQPMEGLPANKRPTNTSAARTTTNSGWVKLNATRSPSGKFPIA